MSGGFCVRRYAASAHRSRETRLQHIAVRRYGRFFEKKLAKNFIVAVAHALRAPIRSAVSLATAFISALTECSFSAPKGAPSSRVPYPGGSVVVNVSLVAQRIGHGGKVDLWRRRFAVRRAVFGKRKSKRHHARGRRRGVRHTKVEAASRVGVGRRFARPKAEGGEG